MLKSQQNMAIWVSNELSHSVEMAYRLEKILLGTFFYKKKGKTIFPLFPLYFCQNSFVFEMCWARCGFKP